MNDELRSKIIKQLLDLKAVSISPNAPFTYASGMKSPIYTDLRMTISSPMLRSDIVKGLSAEIKKAYPNATVIGGVATAGIPHAAWVADALDLPLIYVRSKPKDHGAGKQIEGQLKDDDQVVLIDDLISTGGSVLKAVEAVRKENVDVIGVASIFSYGLPDATKNFADQKTKLLSLLNYNQMVDYLQSSQALSEDEVQSAKEWHQDPWNWKK
ncbi:orotate phosphoribosyltransferase [Pediococcus stilesii]|uniref:Orotate phosphoribosyltransferase n=1 Tax=Pediococcus stilesii TaxID=331679 RepID=A0A0R2KWI2_9LACO|nr:orotate phosphoribosyltransferase [Pediococcus stilesii]KRN93951.1 orotate phosphoribosyltransferase [Pediococcus stilesii]TLQ05759.1 orotate phosphoribosyltransferase [Pediococcus stilesii]